MTKDLKEKAIEFKGKLYILVSDRVLFFNETFLDGSITTELVSPLDSKQVVVKATVIPNVNNPERKFTGYSQAVVGQGYINQIAALENCETSAVGRALAFLGIGVLDSIASIDEIKKAEQSMKPIDQPEPQNHLNKTIKNLNAPASEKQINLILDMAKRKGKDFSPQEVTKVMNYTKGEASAKIEELMKSKSKSSREIAETTFKHSTDEIMEDIKSLEEQVPF